MENNYDEITPSHIITSGSFNASHSILMPTIPIYQLQQTPSEAINLIAETHTTTDMICSANKPINPNSVLNIDVSSDGGGGCSDSGGGVGGTFNNSDNIDWSNSLFRPASRFAISNRRECKSTSDETHIFELNSNVHSNKLVNTNENQLFNVKKSNFLISPTYKSSTNQNRMQFSTKASESCSLSHNNNNPKQIKGQFGFNPNSLKLLSSKIANLNNSTNNSFNEKIANKFTSNSNREKKSVKRLTGNSKFAIETKKHLDFNHNKKLFHAVSNNDYKTVVELLNTNMYDVNCCDDKQRTCLHIASSRGNLDIVRLLLDYGSNPNIRDCVSNLPIHLAIISSHVPVVTVLLEAGTDIHSLDLNGKTVLHLAGTRLRWLLNDENHKASPKLKFEAIMIMNMIKEYLRRKKASTTDLDTLADKLESVFNLDDISNITIELLDKFETLNIKTNIQ